MVYQVLLNGTEVYYGTDEETAKRLAKMLRYNFKALGLSAEIECRQPHL